MKKKAMYRILVVVVLLVGTKKLLPYVWDNSLNTILTVKFFEGW